MKRMHGFWPLVLILSLPMVATARAERGAREDEPAAEASPLDLAGRARQLAKEVGEFARSPAISRAKKEKRISTAVRVAVVAATAYRHTPGESLDAAIELAAAAARAAPAFTEIIAKAVAFAPMVAPVDGAAGRIRSAAFAAARAHRGRAAPRAAVVEPGEVLPGRERREAGGETGPADQRTLAGTDGNALESAPPRPDSAEPAAGDSRGDAPGVDESARTRGPRVLARDDRGFRVTAAFGVRYDDNFYLSNTNEVGETIASATPGVEFDWGQHSLLHGTVGYHEAFSRFTGGTDTNLALGSGAANLEFDDGSVKAAFGATFQQLYQSNPDVLTSGPSKLIRTDLFGANGSVEVPLGSKLSTKVGSTFSDTQYKNEGLVGNRRIDFPLKVFFKVTPKTDLSVGYTQGVQRPTGDGASSKDRYFNLGARGEFTAKLAGTFSFGYQTRQVAANPTERLFAFDGSINYEVTPKTGATLAFTRNFNASALGASTKNSAFRLGLDTDVSPQWQLGVNLAYLENDYGAEVFRPGSVPTPSGRTDRIWEGKLSASYNYTVWLFTSASYTAQRNRSTLTAADFVDNLLSLTMGLRY